MKRPTIYIAVTAILMRLLFIGWIWSDWHVLSEDKLVAAYFTQGYALAAGCGYIGPHSDEGSTAMTDLQRQMETEGLRSVEKTRYLDSDALHPEMLHPPGLPLLVAAALQVFPGLKPDLIIQLLGAFLDTFAACMLAYLAGKFFSRRTAFLAGLVYAIYPPLVFLSVNKSPEGLMSVFILGTLVCLLEGNQADLLKRIAWWMTGGIILGLGSYLRPDYLLVPVALGTGLLLYSRSWLRSIASVLLIQSVALLMLFPWAYRNHELCGRWIFTSTSTGWTLVNGLGAYPNPWGIICDDKYRGIEAKEQGFSHPGSSEADLYFRKVFQKDVINHPGAYVMTVVRRFATGAASAKGFGFQNPYRSNNNKDEKSPFSVLKQGLISFLQTYWDAMLIVALGFVLLLCTIVMCLCERRRFGLIFLLLTPHLYSLAAHAIVHYEPRYILPSMFCFILGVAYVLGRGWLDRLSDSQVRPA